MREIICPCCKSKSLYIIPDIDEDPKPLIFAEYCHICGKDLSREKVYLECCKIWVLDVDYCGFCPCCGKRSNLPLPEVREKIRERERQRVEEERKFREEVKKRLKGVKFETKITSCEYQGSPEDMLSALHRDQARNELLVEDVLREAKDSNNGLVILSDSEEQLGYLRKLLTPKVRDLVFLPGRMSHAGMRDIQANTGPGTKFLIVPAEFMELESRYINRLFLASIFVLDEPLIQQIVKLHNEAIQAPLVIFDYLDQDKEGHFYKMHQERIKLYQREGATKLEDPKGERSTP